MNFRTLHDMSHYFAPMNHYDFNKHMSIYGNGNNGLGYHPNGVFIGGKLNRDEQWEKDDMKRKYTRVNSTFFIIWIGFVSRMRLLVCSR